MEVRAESWRKGGGGGGGGGGLHKMQQARLQLIHCTSQSSPPVHGFIHILVSVSCQDNDPIIQLDLCVHRI